MLELTTLFCDTFDTHRFRAACFAHFDVAAMTNMEVIG